MQVIIDFELWRRERVDRVEGESWCCDESLFCGPDFCFDVNEVTGGTNAAIVDSAVYTMDYR